MLQWDHQDVVFDTKFTLQDREDICKGKKLFMDLMTNADTIVLQENVKEYSEKGEFLREHMAILIQRHVCLKNASDLMFWTAMNKILNTDAKQIEHLINLESNAINLLALSTDALALVYCRIIFEL